MLFTKKTFKIIGKSIGSLILLYLLFLLIAGLYISHRKARIIDYISTELARRLRGKAVIHDFDVSLWANFPAISFQLNGVTLSDSVWHRPAIAAQLVSTSFSVLELIRGKIVIKNLLIEGGELNLLTDSTGYTNQYLLSLRKTTEDTAKTTGSNSIGIEQLRIKNFLISVADKAKEKEISFTINSLSARIETLDSLLEIRMAEKITMKKGLGFNLAKGAFLENQTLDGDWLMHVNQQTHTIEFDHAAIAINKQKFDISGKFILDKQDPSFDIRFNVQQLSYNIAKQVVSAHIRKKLEMVNLLSGLNASGTLHGSLLPAREPAISINWETTNNTAVTDAGRFSNCNFAGSFTNTVNPSLDHVDSNSRISFSHFSGEWDGIPFTADSTSITNLDSARLQMHVISQCRLEDLDNKLSMQDIAFKSGTAVVNLRYDGPIVQDKSMFQDVQGTMRIENGSVEYVPRGFNFVNCNGELALYKDSLRMESFTCNYGENKFNVSAAGRNLRKKFIAGDASGAAVIDCFVHSPFINLDNFTSLFDKRTARKTNKKATGSFAATAHTLDDMLDNSTINVHVNADGLKHNNLKATGLAAVVKFESEYWELTRIALNLAGGTITSSGQILHAANNIHTAIFNVKANNVDVSQLLFAFDDFGQDALTHDHLSGRFSTSASLQASINAKGSIMPASMKGIVDFTLLKASLQNFDAFDNIKPFLLKNRDMRTVRFAELKDKIAIDGQNVFINRMEIQSSAFRLFLQGNYGLAKKNTDLLIQVPFSNLNKNSFDSVGGPVNKGVAAKTGASIWLRAVNREDGTVKVKLTMNKKMKTP